MRKTTFRYAGVSVYHRMAELEKRDIAPPAATERFVNGLKTIAEYETRLSATQPDSV